MDIAEGQVWFDKPIRSGEGYAIYINKDMWEYLGVQDRDSVNLAFKADKGKHGRFIGIGVKKEKKE